MVSQQANPVELAPNLKTILDDLEKADQDARRIAAGLSDEQANWQPSQSAWSIAQCLDHLQRGNTVYAAALHTAIKKTRAKNGPQRGPIQPGWVSRMFIRSLEPPPERKMRSPEKIVPVSRVAGREVLEAFFRSHDDLRAVIRDAAGLDLNRIRFRNPFFGFLRFTVGAGLLITGAHDRRHLWQAERILECPEFPKS